MPAASTAPRMPHSPPSTGSVAGRGPSQALANILSQLQPIQLSSRASSSGQQPSSTQLLVAQTAQHDLQGLRASAGQLSNTQGTGQGAPLPHHPRAPASAAPLPRPSGPRRYASGAHSPQGSGPATLAGPQGPPAAGQGTDNAPAAAEPAPRSLGAEADLILRRYRATQQSAHAPPSPPQPAADQPPQPHPQPSEASQSRAEHSNAPSHPGPSLQPPQQSHTQLSISGMAQLGSHVVTSVQLPSTGATGTRPLTMLLEETLGWAVTNDPPVTDKTAQQPPLAALLEMAMAGETGTAQEGSMSVAQTGGGLETTATDAGTLAHLQGVPQQQQQQQQGSDNDMGVVIRSRSPLQDVLLYPVHEPLHEQGRGGGIAKATQDISGAVVDKPQHPQHPPHPSVRVSHDLAPRAINFTLSAAATADADAEATVHVAADAAEDARQRRGAADIPRPPALTADVAAIIRAAASSAAALKPMAPRRAARDATTAAAAAAGASNAALLLHSASERLAKLSTATHTAATPVTDTTTQHADTDTNNVGCNTDSPTRGLVVVAQPPSNRRGAHAPAAGQPALGASTQGQGTVMSGYGWVSETDDEEGSQGCEKSEGAGSAFPGRSALLCYLLAKAVQARGRRVQRCVLAAWRQAAHTRRVERMLARSVQTLYEERLMHRAFQKWRRWVHDRHNSTHTHSPRHTHKSQHNSQHGSPSSPSRRREHRSSHRPALARDDGSASDAGGESATSPLRAAPSAPTAVAAADAAGAMVACDYGDGMRHFRELHEMLASMERLLAPAHKHSAGNTTHAPEYDQHQHPPAPIRNPDAISIQDGPMYSSMQQPPAQPPPPSQQLPWQARELPSYHVWGDLNLNTNSNVGVSGQARELPSYHSWGETSGRGDGYAARHSADGAPTLATHVAALLRRPATDGGDITSYYGGDGRTAGERVDPSWQSPVRATQSAGGAMAAAAAAGDAPVPRSPQLAAVQRRVQQLEQQVQEVVRFRQITQAHPPPHSNMQTGPSQQQPPLVTQPLPAPMGAVRSNTAARLSTRADPRLAASMKQGSNTSRSRSPSPSPPNARVGKPPVPHGGGGGSKRRAASKGPGLAGSTVLHTAAASVGPTGSGVFETVSGPLQGPLQQSLQGSLQQPLQGQSPSDMEARLYSDLAELEAALRRIGQT